MTSRELTGAPSTRRGANGGHWSFAAGRPRDLRWLLLGQADVVPRSRRVQLGGVLGRLSRMPPYPLGGFYGGHVAIVWRVDGTEFHVTVHDPRNAARARAIAAALASLTVRCPPAATRTRCTGVLRRP